MAFDRPTLDTIYGRMKADLEQRLDEVNWVSRSVILILLAVFAGAIYLCYGFLVRLSKQLFFTTADDEYVEWWARKYGLTRTPAAYATGEVRFSGVDTTVIPAGTEVETVDGTIYTTDEIATISGTTVDVEITASVAGEDGNVSSSTMDLVTPIADIDSTCDVLTDPNGGTDQETITALVSRLLQRTQNPPGSGNIGDYERWALEVAGVGRVWVLDAEDWEGAGTVGVVIADEDLEVVGATIKTAVETYFDARRPVGADVTVTDPIPNNVDFEISITPNTSAYQTLIETALQEAFVFYAEPGGTLKITSIYKAIGSTGVDDWEITGIDVAGAAVSIDNITLTGLNLPRYNSTTFAELV